MKKTKWIQILILFTLCLTVFVPSRTAQAASISVSINNSGYVKVSWNRVKDASKYYIYRSTKKSSGYKKIATVKNKTSYTDKKAKLGKTYYYKVKSNKSAYSKVKKISVNKIAQVQNVKISGSKTANITWSKVKGSTGYKIYRSTSKTSGFKQIASINNKQNSYTDKNIDFDKNYYYQIKAYKNIKVKNKKKTYFSVKADKIGFKISKTNSDKNNDDSDKSDKSDKTDEADNPVIPTVSNEGDGTGKVDLTWTAVSGATGYMIYRNTAAGTKITTDKIITTIASTGESSYSYTDTSCTTGVKYYYKIQSLKNGKVLSTQKFESVATEIEIIRTFNQKEAYKMLALVNAYRTSQGVGTLTWNNTLEKAAMVRSLEQSIILGHERLNGDWHDVYEDGEVIMIGSSVMTAEQCMAQWDAPHLQNIAYDDLTQMGAAFCDGSIVLTFYSNSTQSSMEVEMEMAKKNPNIERAWPDPENFLKYVKNEAEWDGLVDAKRNPTELAKTKYTVIEK